VVVSPAVGAPEDLFALAVAPIAPEPFVPDVSTPLKLRSVIVEATLCESVAVTEILLRRDGAKARQISDVPLCALVRTTNAHVKPAPLTLFTVVFAPER
jgi:hypothetical protein